MHRRDPTLPCIQRFVGPDQHKVVARLHEGAHQMHCGDVYLLFVTPGDEVSPGATAHVWIGDGEQTSVKTAEMEARGEFL